MPELGASRIRFGISGDWFRLLGQVRSDQRRVSLDAVLHRPQDRLPEVIGSRVGV